MESTLAQRITAAGNQRRANEAATLSEFYAAQGQNLPSVDERRPLAQRAGIANYTGAANQNVLLLNYLKQNPLTPAGINISTVPEDIDLVPEFAPNVPEVPRPTFLAPSEIPLSPSERIASDIDTLSAEIRTIEERMAGREAERTAGYEEAGVWEDVRRLNELNASLREAQDRQIEIPLETRQQLRGRGATITEAGQISAPQLERAALEELTLSRQTARLSDSIRLNMAQVDQYIDAEKERDDLLYRQKNNYLTSLQATYGSILTAEQNARLEEKKYQNEINLYMAKKEIDMRGDLLNEILAKGGSVVGLEDSSVGELMSYNNSLRTPEEIALQDSIEASALGYVDSIERLLTNTAGLAGSVGTGIGNTRIGSITGLFRPGQVNLFRSGVKQLANKETLEEFGRIGDRGITLGAISDTELNMVRNAATNLGLIVDSNGNYTGQSNFSETVFKDALREIQNVAKKVFIAEQIGAAAYREANFKDKPATVIDAKFDQLRANPTQQQTNPYQQIFTPEQVSQTVSSTIRQFEGFSPTAYPDAGGWAIGYGSQTHPDGTPVRPGDTVTPAQAEQYLSSAISKHSNWRSLVNTNLTPAQQAALASFEFNLGPAIWQNDATARNIIARINAGDFNTAGQLMQQFNRSQGQVNPGLVQRRAVEARLLNTLG